MPEKEIQELAERIRDKIRPLKIYLFGSYKDGNFRDDSDLDFFVVVPDNVTDLAAETTKAYKAIRSIKTHPVDILISTESRFEERKNGPTIEYEIYQYGILLFETK